MLPIATLLKVYQQLRYPRIASVVLACCLLVCAGCSSQLKGPSGTPQIALAVVVSPSVSYADALRQLTDLGIQPAVFCGYQSDLDSGTAIQGSIWQSAGQRERFQREHRMFVMQSIITASPDWTSQLYALPGFQRDPRTATQNIFCTDGTGSHSTATAPPSAFNVLTRDQVGNQIGTYAYVSFASGVTYDTALYDVSNLGLRLADPCYEYSRLPNHQPQPWHPMGQEVAFKNSHALVVAPAPLISSIRWFDQLHEQPDITAADTSYHPAC